MKPAIEISPDEAAALSMMLAELTSSRLEVILVPQRHYTNIGGMVRCAISKNAPWYSRFCGRHGSARFRKNAAFDTRIKRRETIRILTALCESRATASKYVGDFMREARKRVAEGAVESVFAMSGAAACEQWATIEGDGF